MELATYCADLAQACVDAGAWAARNGELVRGEQEGLLKELRRAARVFRRCSRAAGRKMCAGVFGPTQKMITGRQYLLQTFPDLILIVYMADRNGCKSYDGIHGCTDVMGHIGKEGRFCLVGMLRLHQSILQRLGLFPLLLHLLRDLP